MMLYTSIQIVTILFVFTGQNTSATKVTGFDNTEVGALVTKIDEKVSTNQRQHFLAFINFKVTRLNYEGYLEGQMGVSHMNRLIRLNSKTKTVVIFIGYGGNGANALALLEQLWEAGYTIIAVFMPRFNCTRGTFGHFGTGTMVDRDYEFLEKYIRGKCNSRVIWISVVDLADSASIDKQLGRDAPETKVNDVRNSGAHKAMWASIAEIFKKKFDALKSYSFDFVIDGYMGEGFDDTCVAILLKLYTEFLIEMQKAKKIVGSAELPAGLKKGAGFLAEWSTPDKVPATNFVPNFILMPILKLSLLQMINGDFKAAAGFDEASCQLKGTQILAADVDFNQVFGVNSPLTPVTIDISSIESVVQVPTAQGVQVPFTLITVKP